MSPVMLLNGIFLVTDGTCKFRYPRIKFTPTCGNYRKAFLYIVTYVKSGKKKSSNYKNTKNLVNSEGHSTDTLVFCWYLACTIRCLGNY